MTSPRVLVVDSDPSSLGLLTHGLNRLGLSTHSAANVDQALASIASHRPDVVVSEVDGGAGLRVLEELRQNPATREVPVLLLAKGEWARRRSHARELGAQELVAKPAFVQDIAVLTWLHAGRAATEEWFEGTFGEPSCAALLRGLLAGGRSGSLRLEPSGALVRFRDGAVVDASLPPLDGERALLRILTLGTGSYELSFGPLACQATMQFELADLSGRGLIHVREWAELRRHLDPIDRVYTLDFAALSPQLRALPSGLWSLLRLFDGKRTIADVIADSALDDLTAGRAIAKLKALGLFEQAARGDWDETTPAISRPHPATLFVTDAAPTAELTVDRVDPAPLMLIETMVAQGLEVADASAAAAQAHAELERSFFESPVVDTAEALEARRQSHAPSALRAVFWTAAVALFIAAFVILWRGTPGGALGDQPAAAAAQVATVQPSAAAPLARLPPVAQPAEPALAPLVAVAPSSGQPAASQEDLAAPPDDTQLKALLGKGQSDYAHGHFARALASFDAAKVLAPNDPAVELSRGLALYDLNKLPAAGEALTRAVELDPKNGRAELLLGAIAQEKGNKDLARSHYQKYLEIEPAGEHAAEARQLLSGLP